MAVVLGLVVVGAMAVTLGATVFTNVKIWGLARESRTAFRKLPPERRRRALIQMVAIYAVVLAEAAVILAAPFGVRRTLTYFVIVPFVIVTPVAITITGVRGFRGQRRSRRLVPQRRQDQDRLDR